MKRITTLCVALGLATAGSSAIGGQMEEQVSEQDPTPQPMMMTEAQLDDVSAGLINVLLIDTVDVEDVLVNVPVQANVLANVNAAVAVIGEALAAQPLGNQTQSNRR